MRELVRRFMARNSDCNFPKSRKAIGVDVPRKSNVQPDKFAKYQPSGPDKRRQTTESSGAGSSRRGRRKQGQLPVKGARLLLQLPVTTLLLAFALQQTWTRTC